MSDFRPISLVTSLYNVIAKVLVERLRKVLPTTIDDAQMAFVEGRHMLDAILIAAESIVDYVSRAKFGVMMKIHFEKAFNKVDWAFLDYILEFKSFGGTWQSWIRGCLSHSNISIVINGAKLFILSRGVGQGNHVSPLLFTIVADAFSCFVKVGRDKRLD